MRENYENCAVLFTGHNFDFGSYPNSIGEWDEFYGFNSPRESTVIFGNWGCFEYFTWNDRII